MELEERLRRTEEEVHKAIQARIQTEEALKMVQEQVNKQTNIQASFLTVTCTCTCDCLGCAVLLCLVVCLTLLASFFPPSHLSLKHVCVCTKRYVYCTALMRPN